MLESSQEACEGFGFLCSFKANSYRIFGWPWSSRNHLRIFNIIRVSVKPTYVESYVLKSPPCAEIYDQRRPQYFQYSVLYAQNQTPRRPHQWKNPAHMSISPAYLWRNCVCACARPPICRSVICFYWTSCIGQPIIGVPQVHEWQVSHVAISGFWPLIAVEVWKTNRSIVHLISNYLINGKWLLIYRN